MTVNIFKINSEVLPELENKIKEKSCIHETIYRKPDTHKTTDEIELTFYLDNGGISNDVEWSWIGTQFTTLDIRKRISNPRGWLIIKLSAERVYCITLGIAYHDPNKYCDSDFPFRVLQRLNIKDIKNTTRMNPTSNRRRMIDAFVTMDSIDFEAGDTIQKVTFQIDTDDLRERYSNELCFKESISIGNSIRVNPKYHTLECILDCILDLEEISKLDKVLEVPVLKKIDNTTQIQALNSKLNTIPIDQLNLTTPQYQVIGIKNWDYSEITQIQYCYQKITSSKFDFISIDNLKGFIEQQHIDLSEALTSINVVVMTIDGYQQKNQLVEFIEYVDESERSVFLNGKWFRFNDDYIKFLDSEISDTEIRHQSDYDYINQNLKNIYGTTSEAGFNKYVAANCVDPKYLLLDKEIDSSVGKGKFELCDLYDRTGGALVAVKRVSNSQSFCYVMDQSLTAAKVLKSKGELCLKGQNIKWTDIKKSVIWIVLKRSRNNQLSKDDKDRPRIEDLKYFLAKMKIPTWKRELNNLGIIPSIYLSYENN